MDVLRTRHSEALASPQFDLSAWSSGFPASIHERTAAIADEHAARRSAMFDERRKLATAAALQYRTRLTAYLGGADRYYAFRHMLCAKRGQYRRGLARSGEARAALSTALREEINAIIRFNGKSPEEIGEIARISFASVPANFPIDDPTTTVFPRGPGAPIPPMPSSAIRLTGFDNCRISHNLVFPSDGYGGFENMSDCPRHILGSSIRMGTGDAGDADNFTAEVDCWFEAFTTAPGAGQLRIDVEAYGIDGINHLHTHDEVGYSDSNTRKSASLFVHVIAQTPVSIVDELMCYDPFWEFSYDTAKNHDINDDIIYPKPLPSATAQSGITPYLLGQNKVMPFITNGALHNSPVMVRVGMRRHETIFTNDVSIQSDTTGRIEIAGVWISADP